MQAYEYRVVPAPRRGEKARGVKTTEERFALALTGLMNTLGAEGWDYVRADTLPCDERAGLTGGTKTSYQNMLVFRRPLAAPVLAVPVTAAAPAAVPVQTPTVQTPAAPAPAAPAHAAATPAYPVLTLGQAEGRAPSLGPVKPELAAE